MRAILPILFALVAGGCDPIAAGGSFSGDKCAAGDATLDTLTIGNAFRDLGYQVAAGVTGIAAARSQLNEMTMRQNNWTLGTYCESYCRVVATHHTIEDQSVFPHLRRQDPRLGPVLDRLEAEHHLIHDVLEGVDQALVGLVSGQDGRTELRAAVDQLTDALLSHLSYEERELIEPLARHSFY